MFTWHLSTQASELLSLLIEGNLFEIIEDHVVWYDCMKTYFLWLLIYFGEAFGFLLFNKIFEGAAKLR